VPWIKRLDQFHVASNKPDGRQSRCRDCKRTYREDHSQSARSSSRRYRSAHPDRVKAASDRRYERIRAEVFDHYGQCCACCGSAEELTIDHVNGDGGGRRRKTSSGTAMYYWLIRNGFPDGFQTLCALCNKSKAREMRCRLDHGLTSTAPAESASVSLNTQECLGIAAM
jgi:hypothetical protein